MTQRYLYTLLLIALPLLLLPSTLVAQQARSEEGCRKREELAKQRKEFFARELALTAEEASYLDRVLTEAENKKIPIWRALREQHLEIEKGNLSDEEASAFLEREQQLKSQLAEINEQTMTELRKQIPARKLVNYQQVRREFAKKYLNRRHQHRMTDRR